MAEYETLFLDTIVPVLFGNSRSISYAPSSTSNGWLSLNFSAPVQPFTERYYNKTPGEVYGETGTFSSKRLASSDQSKSTMTPF